MNIGILLLTVLAVWASTVVSQSDFYENFSDNFGDYRDYGDSYDNDNYGLYGWGMSPMYGRGYGMYGRGYGMYGRGLGMYGRGMYGGHGNMYGRGGYFGNRWGYPRTNFYQPWRRNTWFGPSMYMGY